MHAFESLRTRRWAPLLTLWVASWTTSGYGHDLPDARVDRSIQATLRPGRLEIAYEVSLSELTLTQELRELVGPLTAGDREAWFDLYGRETGPMNARGLLATVDGREFDLTFREFTLVVEGHPRFTFFFEAPLPKSGTLTVQDRNFSSSEGTSRLAVSAREGVSLRGDDLPDDVTKIPIVPVWKLSDAEERRTKRFAVEFGLSGRPATAVVVAPAWVEPRQPDMTGGLSGLLGRATKLPLGWLGLLAFALGAAHAAQPGHGKTLVAATALGHRGAARGATLALIVTTVHVGSVLLVALGLWATRSARYAEINQALARGAGFAIAAIGLWRLGRHLAGYGEHDGGDERQAVSGRGLLGLGVAGGMVPCWDAIVLILLAEALGRLALGMALLVAFSMGMATVLVGVGLIAGRLRRVLGKEDGPEWDRRLGIVSGLALAAFGLMMLVA